MPSIKLNPHPGVLELLNGETRNDSQQTELDVAIAMRDKKLPSPQAYDNITLFDLRISGTGVSFRKKFKEYVFRDPALYLNDEFLMRCQGLPVIFEHPDLQVLDSKEFSDRIVGTVLIPYIKGNEVWGIAKIYDDEAAEIMAKNQLSTSPSVVFRDPSVNEKMELGDGSHLLIEGKPSLLDHLAIEKLGVWDKGGKPSGVKSNLTETNRADSADPTETLTGANNMAELNPETEVKKDEAGEGGMGEVLSMLKTLSADMNEMKGKIAQLESAEGAEADAGEESLPDPKLATAADPDNADPSADISAVAKRVDALEQKTSPVPEDEASKMADAQAKADSVYGAFGDKAPRPMLGESLMAYRKRLASKVQVHSAQFGKVNLAAVSDSALLDAVEAGIYADALQVAGKPAEIADGVLMETHRTDATGRRITEYKGSPSAWTGAFKATRRRVTGIRNNFN